MWLCIYLPEDSIFEVGKSQQHGYAADVFKGGRNALFLVTQECDERSKIMQGECRGEAGWHHG